jgi:ariadne-1
MSDDEQYEYEEEAEDEEYNYEDGDSYEYEEATEEKVNNSISEEGSGRKRRESSNDGAASFLSPGGGDQQEKADASSVQPSSSSKKSPGLGLGLGSHEKNPLIRETSSSYELVVPIDSYVIRPLTDITPLLSALVNEVSNLLDIHEDESQAILQFVKYDKEKLTDSYFNNPEKIRSSVGIDLWSPDLISRLLSALPTSSMSVSPSKKRERERKNNSIITASSLFKCRICCDDEVSVEESFCLGCNHLFCRSCFTEYLKNAISDGASCILTHCPEHKCKQLVTTSLFHLLLEGVGSEGGESSNEKEEVVKKYDLYFLRDFIEKSKNMKYCPAPRCEKVAIGSGTVTHCMFISSLFLIRSFLCFCSVFVIILPLLAFFFVSRHHNHSL